jgi:recombination protein RecA
VLDVAVELGFVKKAGAWFTYEGEQMGQGRENVKTFLRENPAMMAEIDARVRERMADELLPDVVGVSSELDVDTPISLD